MVKNKNFKMAKRLLLVLGITLLATTSAYAYAKYSLHKFNLNEIYNTSLEKINTSINDMTKRLNTTADNLKDEKNARSSDISQLNGEIDQANKYAESVSSAVADADKTNSTASSAISKADDAINYDPSPVSSSAN